MQLFSSVYSRIYLAFVIVYYIVSYKYYLLCSSLLPASFYYPFSRLLMLLEGELYIAICKGGTDKVILTRGNISRYTYIEGDTKKMN